MSRRLLAVSVILGGFVFGLPCRGQTPPAPPPPTAAADVKGQVMDASGIFPLTDAVVEASDPNSQQTEGSAITDAAGGYTIHHLSSGKYNLTAWKPDYQAVTPPEVTVASTTVTQDFYLRPGKSAGEFYRTILGVQQTGASSTTSTQKLFADMYMDVPGPKIGSGEADPVYGPRLRFWGDVQVTSVPETSPIQLSQLSLKSATNLNTSQLVQSVRFTWGQEFRVFGNPPEVKAIGDAPGAPYVNRNNNPYDITNLGKFTGSLFLGIGALTPLNPQQSTTLVDGTSGTVGQLYQDLTGSSLTSACAAVGASTSPSSSTPCAVALVSKDRTQFLFQWYAGLRLKTHYFTAGGIPIIRPPAVFDLAVGQNELVTGGRLHGMALKMEGFFPLPFQKLGMIYLFGRADMQLKGKPVINNAYILNQAPSTITLASSGVVTAALPPPTRDVYEIGIGADLIPIVGKLIKF